MSGFAATAPSLEALLKEELVDSLTMTLSLEGLAHHVELLTRLALLEPITLARHHALVALQDREDWPEEEGNDLPSRRAADDFLHALCDAAGDGPRHLERAVDGVSSTRPE